MAATGGVVMGGVVIVVVFALWSCLWEGRVGVQLAVVLYIAFGEKGEIWVGAS